MTPQHHRKADEFLEHLRRLPSAGKRLVHVEVLPPRKGEYRSPEGLLSPAVQAVLARAGITRLYSHQAEALEHLLQGQHTAIVTSTASGKTLCYNLAVLEAFEQAPTSRALYLFPTKALAQDQLRKLKELEGTLFQRAATYDGDTPTHVRSQIRRQAPVVLSNPDMLHLGILPNHALWANFFSRLKYVVLDEVHLYKGLFGAHTANVIRRLRRIAAHYGASPTFVCCSATVPNPRELVEALLGLEVELVEADGAPHGPKYIACWNPPLVRRSDGSYGRNYLQEARNLLLELLESGLRTLTFAQARVLVELLLKILRDQAHTPEQKRLVQLVEAYRAGYLPAERRQLEQRLFKGELLGVISTSALEVGLDLGGLEAALLVGFPGTLASFWQQLGRAGRGEAPSLGIFLAANGVLDQYYMHEPGKLFHSPTERAVVNPENRYILASHLLCAAHELPLKVEDEALFGPETSKLLPLLAEAGYLAERPARREWYWTGLQSPASEVNLRASTGAPFQICLLDGRLLGTVEAATALLFVHPGAVYLHQGAAYLVRRLDLERRTAYVEPSEVQYFTRALTSTKVKILETAVTWDLPGTTLAFGELETESQVVGYTKLRARDHSLLERVPLDLPPSNEETLGLWFTVSPDLLQRLESEGLDAFGAMHALEHALIGLAGAFVTLDPFELQGASYPHHPELGEGGIFLYDAYPGGAGLAEALAGRFVEWLEATGRHVANCECKQGCPACIISPNCGSGNQPLDKQGAVRLAELLLEKPAGAFSCGIPLEPSS